MSATPLRSGGQYATADLPIPLITHARQRPQLIIWATCRDLISSADTILEMTRCCDGVLQNIKHIQVGCSQTIVIECLPLPL